MGIIVGILYFIFVISCLLLILVILLQEGKGGGFGEAFGGIASETFGVKASGITRFTAILAGIFLGSSVLIAILAGHTTTTVIRDATGVPAGAASESGTGATEGKETPAPGAESQGDASQGGASQGDPSQGDPSPGTGGGKQE